MDESGIDMGFDLATFLTKDFSVDQKVLEEMTAAQQHQDFMFYELKSKAVPITERVDGEKMRQVQRLEKLGFR
ncbi:unnamed protein product [Spodoptera littoralis]|uniref:Uncharacterized protein n=1 Tax=Spodoptera littoralis TaxID=7109 RepID=A0A9P0IAD8_SPOLI|nr:unnamed protein product [Spodoptera littoralis]CAH1643989.1 unnamed protein product [Spodoptera littoralis]